MKNIHLHGRLGKKFGKLWTLAVSSPAEAVRAIESRTHKLFDYLYKGDKRGITYRVVIGNEDVTDVQELMHDFADNVSDIHFYPVPRGAGGLFQTILGIIIIIIAVVVSFYNPPAGATLMKVGGIELGATATFFVMMGATMAIGGISQMIMGTPGFSAVNPSAESPPSYYFSGARNNMRQGGPIPLGYGRMIVGSQVISMAVRTEKIAVGGGAGSGGDTTWNNLPGTDATVAGGGGYGNAYDADYYRRDNLA